MNIDKRVLYIVSVPLFFLIFFTLFVPYHLAKVVAALLLVGFAVAAALFIKKRNILSINKRQVLMLSVAIGLLFVVLYFLSGFYFGFVRVGGTFGSQLTKYVLPVCIMIIASEIIRAVFAGQNSKGANFFVYLALVFADVLIVSNFSKLTNFNNVMEFAGLTLLPAITANLVYGYIAKRYGALPNVAYRLIVTLIVAVIPYRSGMSDALFSVAKIIAPILFYAVISWLYERRRTTVQQKSRKWSVALSCVVIALAVGLMMLISCQFRFGALVIGSESMTGEVNKGDTIIFERYDEQIIQEGQVIVFKKYNSTVIHRVVEIRRVDGQNRYYTKGDANPDRDVGYITDGDIMGVANYRIPYLGYPTIWLRELFSK